MRENINQLKWPNGTDVDDCFNSNWYKLLNKHSEAYREFFIRGGQLADQHGQLGTQNPGDLF